MYSESSAETTRVRVRFTPTSAAEKPFSLVCIPVGSINMSSALAPAEANKNAPTQRNPHTLDVTKFRRISTRANRQSSLGSFPQKRPCLVPCMITKSNAVGDFINTPRTDI